MHIKEKIPLHLINISNLPSTLGGGKAQGLKFLKDLKLDVPEALVLLGELKSDKEAEDIFQILNSERIAVRSSSEDEDQICYSSAGQYETILNVSQNWALIEAVDHCRLSQRSVKVQNYNRMKGIKRDKGNTVLPLIIQKMIDPIVAGVLFTVNPVNGSKGHLLIEAVEGCGKKVVDGTSDTTSYKIDRIQGKISRNGEDILKENLLRELEAGALKAEEAAGHPLDMEWAVDINGKVWWIQSRPVTTINSHMLDSTILDDNSVLTTGNIGEVFSGSVTPLTYSTAGIALDVGMQKMYRRVGVPLKEEKREHFIQYFDNHLFYFMSNIWEMASYVLNVTADQMDLSICGTPIQNKGELKSKKSTFRRFINLLRYMNLLMKPEKLLREMSQLNENFHIPHMETKNKASTLYYSLVKEQEKLNHIYFLHYAVSGHSALMNLILKKSLKDNNKFLSSLSDISGIESAMIPIELKQMAKEIMKVDNCSTYLNLNTDDQLKWINERANIKLLWDEFMINHGHRSIKELEMREKEWAADPHIILSNITGMIGSIEREQCDTTEQINISAWTRFPRKVNRAREGVRKRERSKSLLVKFQSKFKSGWRNLAKLMVASHKLDAEDSLYFLTKEELGILLNSKNKSIVKTYNSLALRRKEHFTANDLLHFPLICRGRPQPLTINDDLNSINTLKGIPVSKGVYTGIVRIVRSIADADQLMPGEIMVSSFTDIGWSPYFSVCSALITELGSPLSHGAVVAREYGIPLVSSVKDATVILKNGNIVQVNGTAGYIKII